MPTSANKKSTMNGVSEGGEVFTVNVLERGRMAKRHAFFLCPLGPTSSGAIH